MLYATGTVTDTFMRPPEEQTLIFINSLEQEFTITNATRSQLRTVRHHLNHVLRRTDNARMRAAQKKQEGYEQYCSETFYEQQCTRIIRLLKIVNYYLQEKYNEQT